MGLAASQGRFLGLTARKSNVEFQGQQTNQARTTLADLTANFLKQSLALDVPIPPNASQYTNTTYSWTDQNNANNTLSSLVPIPNAQAGQANYNITTTTNNTPQPAIVERNATGRMTSITIGGVAYNLNVETQADSAAYDDAMQQYEYDKQVYEKALDDINSKQAIIQSEDKTLELKLKQLDTEQQAIQTEMEAVTKVIDKNVESTFKLFA